MENNIVKGNKERFTTHASLCGGGDSLKALGSVAHYLADRSLNLSNDKLPEAFELFTTFSDTALEMERFSRHQSVKFHPSV